MTMDGQRPAEGRPTGRKAEAKANDIEIMSAAFDLLTTDPRASMADIAARAEVGVASLYRRYPTRQALVHQLCLRAMTSITTAAETCTRRLDDPTADAWPEFVAFLSSALAAGAGAMRALAGTFDADTDLGDAAAQMNTEIQHTVTLGQNRGALRRDITAADITQFFEMLRAIRIGDHQRNDELRKRYLQLFATALHAASATEPLPVSAPQWNEINATWTQQDTNATSPQSAALPAGAPSPP